MAKPGPGDKGKNRVKNLKARRAQILSTSAGGQGGRPRKKEEDELKRIDAVLIDLGHKPKPYGKPNSNFGIGAKGTKSYRK